MDSKRSVQWAVVGTLSIWAFAFAMACRLVDPGSDSSTADDSLLSKFMGDTRFAFSGTMVVRADRYFHKGVDHYEKKALKDRFQRLADQITPPHYIHLSGDSVREIMPWLYFSIQSDPHNLLAYEVAAYWLAGDARRPDLAEQVLMDAQRNNPRNYQVYMERGRLYLGIGRLETAERMFDVGLKLWPGKEDIFDSQVMIDKADMLVFRGLLCEMRGDMGRAVADFQEAVNRFPGRTAIKRRMQALQSGSPVEVSASALCKIMLVDQARMCDHHEDEENGNPGE